MDSSHKEVNICLMEDHEDNEVISCFSYHDLFRILKLNKEKSKLRKIVSNSKETISLLKIENQNLME